MLTLAQASSKHTIKQEYNTGLALPHQSEVKSKIQINSYLFALIFHSKINDFQ